MVDCFFTDGLLVCNEQEPGRVQTRWNQSSSILFTQVKESKFPDIYITEEVSSLFTKTLKILWVLSTEIAFTGSFP